MLITAGLEFPKHFLQIIFFSNSNKDLIFQLSGNAQNVARLFKTLKKLAR